MENLNMLRLIAPVKFFRWIKDIYHLNQDVENLQLLIGKQLQLINKSRHIEIIENLHLAEFKVFSQFGDDGIIQFLVDYLEITEKTFVEFGVEDYREANTRFLLLNNNWRGLIMDASAKNMQTVKLESMFWKSDLRVKPVFITKENINSLIEENGFSGEIGLMHIDLDGNDYWIWKEISVVDPIIVIMEYNSIYGFHNTWTVPYQKDFSRTAYHYSNLGFGASLQSLCDLADEKGYYFIGSNSHGNNAYFIKKAKIKGLKPLSAEEGYVESKFRESRNEDGTLSYLSGGARLKAISGLSVYNTRTGNVDRIS